MALDSAEHQLLARFSTTVERWPRSVALGLSVVSIPLLGALDYLSGPALAFSVFYLLPLSIIGWVSSHRFLPQAAGLLAALTWSAADVYSGTDYSNPLVPIWNTTTRLVIFLVVVMLLQNLRSSFAEQRNLARTDALTKVANSRAFMEHMSAELDRAQRFRTPLSLIYVDVDDFKTVNDTHGHPAGDEVLKRVAKVLTQSTRTVDTVGRLGGDEFAILMPSTEEAGASKVLAVLPRRLESGMQGLPFPVTLSAGCVTFVDPPAGVGAMLQAADELMYEAKNAGKNKGCHRVVHSLEDKAPAL